jgi:hypothetical protein
MPALRLARAFLDQAASVATSFQFGSRDVTS